MLSQKIFNIDSDLGPETKLYRYVSIEAFMSFLETNRTVLTNINSWDDTWEVAFSKIPYVDDEGNPDPLLWEFYQDIFGQCWSLTEESDAMWRIYSPSCTGVRLESSVEKFSLIGGVQRGYLGKVIYCESVRDFVEQGSLCKSPLHEALLKRIAFEHEREVRFLTHGDFLEQSESEAQGTHISLPLDPAVFIEGVTIDPRADGWYVRTVEKYCARLGLTVKPVKSDLYESDPHLKLGFVRQWVSVPGTKNDFGAVVAAE